MATKPYIIALEEHYFDAEVKRHITGLDATNVPRIVERLDDVGALRLKRWTRPASTCRCCRTPIRGCRSSTPRPLSDWRVAPTTGFIETVRAHPDRFAAFAAIPTPDPKAAADELERTVTRLGFKGAMVNGLTNGLFLDDKRFWPIFERAQALDVPLYMHPSIPHPRSHRGLLQGLCGAIPARCCAPPGALRSRPRRRACVWY